MNRIVPERGLLIGGEWRPSASHGTAEIESPFDGHVVGSVPLASAIEVKQAVDSAAGALLRERLTPSQRSAILRRTAERLRERSDELARLLALESGKPMREARGEVARVRLSSKSRQRRAAASAETWFPLTLSLVRRTGSPSRSASPRA